MFVAPSRTEAFLPYNSVSFHTNLAYAYIPSAGCADNTGQVLVNANYASSPHHLTSVILAIPPVSSILLLSC